MGFKDSAEVVKYIGGIFEDAFADPEIGPKLVDTGLVVAYDFADPDVRLVIDMGNKHVREGLDGGSAPTATLSMSADTGNAFWQGKINLPMAMAKKKIAVAGNVLSLLKLAPLSSRLYPRYIARLEEDGRKDLIV